MAGEINSLNASVAAGVLMYEALRQRRVAFINRKFYCILNKNSLENGLFVANIKTKTDCEK